MTEMKELHSSGFICFLLFGMFASSFSSMPNCTGKDKEWISWESWSICSKSCGTDGVRMRYRYCALNNQRERIFAVDKEQRDCSRYKCPRSRNDYYDMSVRDLSLCLFYNPVNGGWGEWRPVSRCIASYIGEIYISRRYCDSPSPMYCGHHCKGDNIRLINCSLNVRFAIDFRKNTIREVPEVSNVNFPATDGISICFWYKCNSGSYSGLKTVAQYFSPYIPPFILGDFGFLIYFYKNVVNVNMKSSRLTVFRNFPLNKWTHLCWTWDSLGNWKIYINGTSKSSGKTTITDFIGRFPQSTGYVMLGQHGCQSNKIKTAFFTFIGGITQLYLYHKKLSTQEISSVFRNKAPIEDIVVGWWQFKGKVKGGNITETKYPF